MQIETHLNCYCWPEVGLDMGQRNEREVSLYPLNYSSAPKSEHRPKIDVFYTVA